jgi:formylglycine-generating enzyme required for sulfatase activity
MPSRYVSWYQAKRACENAGKRLCASDEWRAACVGPSEFLYPYGDQYEEGACNDKESPFDEVTNTGSFEGCEGGYSGLFDLTGNIDEWTATCWRQDDMYSCRWVGGYFFATEPDCYYGFEAKRYPYQWSRYAGFRCCLSL